MDDDNSKYQTERQFNGSSLALPSARSGKPPRHEVVSQRPTDLAEESSDIIHSSRFKYDFNYDDQHDEDLDQEERRNHSGEMQTFRAAPEVRQAQDATSLLDARGLDPLSTSSTHKDYTPLDGPSHHRMQVVEGEPRSFCHTQHVEIPKLCDDTDDFLGVTHYANEEHGGDLSITLQKLKDMAYNPPVYAQAPRLDL